MDLTHRVSRPGSPPAPGLRATIWAALGLTVFMGACASGRDDRPDPAPRAAESAPAAGQPSFGETAQSAASEAARQPLKDVGLMRRPIPPALARISDPYAAPSGPGCGWLMYEINQIDMVLEPETVAPGHVDDRSGVDRGRDMAGAAMVDAAKSAFVGLLPARGIIRRLSGADQADKAYREAEARGRVRRGYLKGMAQAQNCVVTPPAPVAGPARPRPVVPNR